MTTMASDKSSPTPAVPASVGPLVTADPLSEKHLEELGASPPLGHLETDKNIPTARLSSASRSASPAAEATESNEPEKKRWYSGLLFRRKGKPPIPAERQLSGEAAAGFFNLLIFHWVEPLMHVRTPSSHCPLNKHVHGECLSSVSCRRLDTRGHWRRATFGS